jgi:hypothetical protein
LNARNRRHGIFASPAKMPLAWRSPSTNRAIITTFPPWRVKNPSALPRRSSASQTWRPNRSTSARPPKWPMANPTLSPASAARNPISATATMLSCPAPA